ncbi:hypothetical protein DFA_00554 [Cavenderia fasciculata]|uniref:DNA damage-binding protein 1 n=1 Tax=Cavenderia fasciculata TaxID=261658 RepID=F4PSK1_CACFS|nr:uncharacterized protein DFA_00554 [Cavenderia fasciculata]EGG20693.1 hypothetical protein DFA_00554 [Cavenderia fasciculata]|eukprot:XP_004358543.1 hypothetical protein DFA_00554 [Cavenderia fasciculata]
MSHNNNSSTSPMIGVGGVSMSPTPSTMTPPLPHPPTFYCKNVVQPSCILETLRGRFFKDSNNNCGDSILLVKETMIDVTRYNDTSNQNSFVVPSSQLSQQPLQQQPQEESETSQEDSSMYNDDISPLEPLYSIPLFSIVRQAVILSPISTNYINANTMAPTTATSTTETMSEADEQFYYGRRQDETQSNSSSSGGDSLSSRIKKLVKKEKYIDSDFRDRDILVVTSDSCYLSFMSWSNTLMQFISIQQYKISGANAKFDTKSLGSKIRISSCQRLIAVCAIKDNIMLLPVNTNRATRTTTTTIVSKRIDLKIKGPIICMGFLASSSPDNNNHHLIYLQVSTNTEIHMIEFNLYTNEYSIRKTHTLKDQQLVPYQFISIPNQPNLFFLVYDSSLILFNRDLHSCYKINFSTIYLDFDENVDRSKEMISSFCWTDDEKKRQILLLTSDQGSLYRIELDLKTLKSFTAQVITHDLNPIKSILLLPGDNRTFLVVGDLADSEIIRLDNEFKSVAKDRIGGFIQNNSPIIDFCIDQQIPPALLPPTSTSSANPLSFSQQQLLLQSSPTNSNNNLNSSNPLLASSDTNYSTTITDNNNNWLFNNQYPNHLQTKVFMICGGGPSFGGVRMLENCAAMDIILKIRCLATGIWSYSYQSDIITMVSLLSNETIIFQFYSNNDASDITSNCNFVTDQTTLYSGVMTNAKHYLQATPDRIRAVSCAFDTHVDWFPAPEYGSIVQCTNRESDIIVSLSRQNTLVHLEYINGQFIQKSIRLFDSDISTIHLPNSFVVSSFSRSTSQSQILSKYLFVGTYTNEIHILSMDDDKLLSTIYSYCQLQAIPHSIVVSPLGDINHNLKIIVGMRDGCLVKFEWNDITSNPFTQSIIFTSQLSKSHVEIIANEEKGALIITDRSYYVTGSKGHLSLATIPFNNASGGAIHSTNVGGHENLTGLYIASVDFSKNNITKIPSRDIKPLDQGPKKLLFIKEFHILVLIYDKHIFIRDSNYKILYQREHNMDKPLFLNYWNTKNLIIYGGESNQNSSTRNNRGIAYFLNIHLQEVDIGITEFKTLQQPIPINSIVPLSDGNIIVSTSNETTILDIANRTNTSLMNAIITTSSIQCISYQPITNRVLFGTLKDGMFLYNYNSSNNSLRKKIGQNMPLATAQCVFITDELFAGIDRFGNFLVLEYDELLDADVDRYEVRDPVSNYSIKEGCLGLQRMEQSNNILASGSSGGLYLFARLGKEEYQILETLQSILCQFDLTKSLTGNDHQCYRSEVSMVKNILDGDMLVQYLELQDTLQISIATIIIDELKQKQQLLNLFEMDQQPKQSDNNNIQQQQQQLQLEKQIVTIIINLLEKINNSL